MLPGVWRTVPGCMKVQSAGRSSVNPFQNRYIVDTGQSHIRVTPHDPP